MVAYSATWSNHIILLSPLFNDGLGLLESVKDFAVQEVAAEPAVETLDKAVLLRTARLVEKDFTASSFSQAQICAVQN